MNGVLIMELVFGLLLSLIVLGFMIWGAKTGQFDDGEKQSSGLLFDSVDDLNDAIAKEKKQKENIKKDKIN
jgi:cbb3-type cytochrome oxidase maturation protein